MEKLPNPIELGEKSLNVALSVGKFVVDRLRGGAWANLSNENIYPAYLSNEEIDNGALES